MNKTTEALKLSEAYIAGMKWSEEADEALAAIREVLAEPVSNERLLEAAGYTKKAEPVKQEPVAWHEPNAYGNVTTHKKWAEENGWLPLYTKE